MAPEVKGKWSLHRVEQGPEKPLPKVLVIGAGMSGLVVGRILRDTGFAVEIFEARDRLGGRIWTDTRLGVPCDLGASWIHGARRNPLSRWCESLGITTLRLPSGGTRFYRAGRSIALPVAFWKARRGLWRAGYAYARSLLHFWNQKRKGHWGGEPSVADVLDPVCEDRGLGDVERQTLWWVLGLLEAINGAPARDLGILQLDPTEYWQASAVPLGGFKGLIEDAARGLRIHLNRPVQKVLYGPCGVKLVTADGVRSGEVAIVSLPLGVLRHETQIFEPPLPPRKRRAIEKIGDNAVLNKAVFRFPLRFWPAGREKLAVLPGDRQLRGLFPVWADFSPTTHSPLLVGFASGAHAAHLDEGALEQEMYNHALRTLAGMFSLSVPSPLGHVITRWLSDPWSRGSYSYGRVGSGPEWRRALAEPVGERLFFVGEATHEEHYGTVHGALLSAEREAIRVHKRYCCAEQHMVNLPWRRGETEKSPAPVNPFGRSAFNGKRTRSTLMRQGGD